MGMKDQFKEKSEQLQERARQHGQPAHGAKLLVNPAHALAFPRRHDNRR